MLSQSLLQLVNALNAKSDLSKVNGLIYRVSGKVIMNPACAFIEDLDALPFPARNKLNPDKYKFEVPGKGFVSVASTALTRGCPFQCVFCSEPLNAGRKLRCRSAANVVSEMRWIKDNLGIKHIYMLDSTLTVNRALVMEFCRQLIDCKLAITFEGQTRANLVDQPLLELMKQAGLVRLSFGLESVDKEVLRLMRKDIDPEDLRRALHLCRGLNITTLCGAMMGNPGDTRQTILKTARFVRSTDEIVYAPLAIAIPYPGTELFKMASLGMHGLRLIETDYRKYARYAGGVMEIDGMAPAEIVKLQRRALIIMHSSWKKVIGVIKHFGFINLLRIAVKIIWQGIVAKITGTEPVIRDIECQIAVDLQD